MWNARIAVFLSVNAHIIRKAGQEGSVRGPETVIEELSLALVSQSCTGPGDQLRQAQKGGPRDFMIGRQPLPRAGRAVRQEHFAVGEAQDRTVGKVYVGLRGAFAVALFSNKHGPVVLLQGAGKNFGRAGRV